MAAYSITSSARQARTGCKRMPSASTNFLGSKRERLHEGLPAQTHFWLPEKLHCSVCGTRHGASAREPKAWKHTSKMGSGVGSGSWTMSIRPFLNGEGFDEQQIEAMGSAFQEVISVLHVKPSTPPIVRKVIAARIIEAAKDGQRDPHELCKLTLKALKA